MKKVKNYIEPDLAKKKIARYKYWSIKDEGGITIRTSDENNPDKKSFAEVLKEIIKDNVDAEIQIRYGTSDQSSRQNPPLFMKVNEKIEWVEPQEETVSINGINHPVDNNGNVNINLSTPATNSSRAEKAIPIDTFRQEIDMRLDGIRREHELKEEKWQIEMQNKLMEQTLKFREMMLAERESRLLQREQMISQQEQNMSAKENEIQGTLAGYIKQVPGAIGKVIDFFGENTKKDGLGKTKEKPKKERKAAEFTVEEETNTQKEEVTEAQEQIPENSNTPVQPKQEDDVIEFEEITPTTTEQNKSSPPETDHSTEEDNLNND